VGREAYEYDPWGLLLPGRTLGGGTKEGFTGKERDAESGLDYFGARLYMPALGLWTGRDPLADKYPEWSPYNYALNNPVTYGDPFGLCPKKAADGAICVDFFIADKWVWLFKGDDRGHDPNAPAGRSRAQFVIDPTDPYAYEGSSSVSRSCNFMYCGGPSSSNSSNMHVSDDGSFTLQFNLKDGAAPLGLAPDLNGWIRFSPDGKGGYTTSGVMSGFPSKDIYRRANGEWTRIAAPYDGIDPMDLFDFGRAHMWGNFRTGSHQ
jgi:RHS repeat-associated protein